MKGKLRVAIETRVQFAAHNFAVDAESRTITGLIVPFGEKPIDGRDHEFAAGDISWSNFKNVKMNLDHVISSSFAYGVSLAETDAGIVGSFKVAEGTRGDEALSLAESGVYDGMSVGLFQRSEGDGYHLSHVALTAEPAFDSARVTQIAASAERQDNMGDTPDTITAESIATAITEAFAALNVNPGAPQGPAEPPKAPATVNEAAPYRFDGVKGEHEFSADVFAAMRFGDSEARARLDKFVAETFVSTGNVGSLNPAPTLPGMWVDYLGPAMPVFSALRAGAITDGTPFIVPKFQSSGNVINDHDEGVEPTTGTYVTTSQTVTPEAVSGLYTVTRETIDAGGSPAVSGLLWTHMNRKYAEALEAKAAAMLNASAATVLGTYATAADVEGILLDGVFTDGSEFWDGNVLTHRDLFRLLASEEDADGRKMYPMQAPSNANGTTAARFRSMDVGGYEFQPAKSLGAANALGDRSFLGDFAYAPAWSSAPTRIDWETVANVNIGLHGYFAGAVIANDRVFSINGPAA